MEEFIAMQNNVLNDEDKELTNVQAMDRIHCALASLLDTFWCAG